MLISYTLIVHLCRIVCILISFWQVNCLDLQHGFCISSWSVSSISVLLIETALHSALSIRGICYICFHLICLCCLSSRVQLETAVNSVFYGINSVLFSFKGKDSSPLLLFLSFTSLSDSNLPFPLLSLFLTFFSLSFRLPTSLSNVLLSPNAPPNIRFLIFMWKILNFPLHKVLVTKFLRKQKPFGRSLSGNAFFSRKMAGQNPHVSGIIGLKPPTPVGSETHHPSWV